MDGLGGNGVAADGIDVDGCADGTAADSIHIDAAWRV